MSTCCVCLEPYRRDVNPPLTCNPCGHGVCEPCLAQWRQTGRSNSRTCPQCRQRITSTIVNRDLLAMLEENSSPPVATAVLPPDSQTTTPEAPVPSSLPDIDFNIQSSQKEGEILHDKSQYSVYVLDNSVSMSEVDGKVVLFDAQKHICVIEGITRWEEAQSKAVVIADYNIKRKMPAAYYLLNPSSSNWIEGEDFVNIDPNVEGYQQNLMILKDKILHINNIRGATPLDSITRHIKNSLDKKNIMVPVCYNIITDGEPNKKQLFENELRYLANHFTIFLTINLCTDDDDIIEYYNDLDVKIGSELGGLDVIDDYKGEQLEVIKAGNTFITYSHDIHICRMAGCNSVVADLLDETTLSVFHANKLVKELLNNPSDLPHWTNRQAYI